VGTKRRRGTSDEIHSSRESVYFGLSDWRWRDCAGRRIAKVVGIERTMGFGGRAEVKFAERTAGRAIERAVVEAAHRGGFFRVRVIGMNTKRGIVLAGRRNQ
jgi:hypothetical protein